MKDSDKHLVKAAGATAIDAAVVSIDTALGVPVATGIWGLSKAFLGRGIALRQNKALEWVEMIRDNPAIFTRELLESEEFQDTFVICLEAYLKERSYEKRVLLQAIFRDYTSVKNPETYPVERLYEITRQITLHEAKSFSCLLGLSEEVQPGSSFEGPFGDMESTLHLASLGLLILDDTPRVMSDTVGPRNPRLYISSLGGYYAKFIQETDVLTD